MVAAQADQKTMNSWTKRWKEIAYGSDHAKKDSSVGDLNDFLRDFAGGA